jgi:2-dehydropantoate 2-reductase
MDLAIMGAGSLGTILGALLTKKGYDIDLIDVNVDHVNALNKNGAKVVGLMEMVQPVKAITPDQMRQYDIIFFMTKTTHFESALPYCKKALKPDGVLVCMQNGLPEYLVFDQIEKERVVGCVTGWGATYLEPGVSRLTSEPEHSDFEIGELDGTVTDRLHMIEGVLRQAFKVNILTNLVGIRWSKLTSNCCFSGMSAIVAGTFGDVLDNPKAVRCSAHIMNESMAIAAAAGVKPELFQGFDFTKLTFKTQKERELNMLTLVKQVEHHRNIRTGMLYDIEAGRVPEIETAYNGIFVKWGQKYGVPTPVNSQVVDIVKGMMAGTYKIEPANLDRIKLPELPVE